MFIIKWLLKKPLYLVFIVGVALIIASMAVGKANDNFDERATLTTATITDMSGTRPLSDEPKVIVTYNVGGKDYERPLNYYDENMTDGAQVEILYDYDMPERIRALYVDTEKQEKDLRTWGITLAAVAVGFTLLKKIMKQRKKNKKKNKSSGSSAKRSAPNDAAYYGGSYVGAKKKK